MKNEKERVLKQALVAVLSAARELGVDGQVVAKAITGLLGNDPRYSGPENPNANSAASEIAQAAEWVERQGD